MGKFETTLLSTGYTRLDILSHVLKEAAKKTLGFGRKFVYTGSKTFSFLCMGDKKWGAEAGSYVRTDTIPLISSLGSHWNYDAISPTDKWGKGRTADETYIIIRQYIKDSVDSTGEAFTVAELLQKDAGYLEKKYGEIPVGNYPELNGVAPELKYPNFNNYYQKLEAELMEWMTQERIGGGEKKNRINSTPFTHYFKIFNHNVEEKWKESEGPGGLGGILQRLDKNLEILQQKSGYDWFKKHGFIAKANMVT